MKPLPIVEVGGRYRSRTCADLTAVVTGVDSTRADGQGDRLVVYSPEWRGKAVGESWQWQVQAFVDAYEPVG